MNGIGFPQVIWAPLTLLISFLCLGPPEVGRVYPQGTNKGKGKSGVRITKVYFYLALTFEPRVECTLEG